ncbi:MAG TPA: EAL domain-containing protein [Polyangiaceae bacterium]
MTRATNLAAQSKCDGTVVVVDDDPAVLRALVRILNTGSYHVTPCVSPLEAIEHVAHGNVVVVVSDVSMPEMTGVELLRTIRDHNPDLPVVLVTGLPDVKSAAAAVEYGAFRYLVKPVDPDSFKQSVERAARLYRLAQAKREALSLLGDGKGASDRAGLEANFERALGGLWMAFQPILGVPNRSVLGYEALLRSDEPSLPGPGEVLDAAEKLGALTRLGRAVRRKAAKPIWELDSPCLLFVNLHPRDLLDPDLHDKSTTLAAIADRVVLEITERAAITDVESVRTTLSHLREIGFRIAIDDLGAGYAGLSSFALLEPEFVKLDMSLIRDVDTMPVKQKVVTSMNSLCKDMGLLIVAEGVETKAECDTLVELGCDLFQGYLFARPGRPFPDARW